MNPHSIIVNFPTKMIGGGITIQPQIIFTKHTDALDETHNSSDLNIIFQKVGTIKWQYDNTAFLLVPGEWTFELFDGNNFISNLLFFDNAVDKNPMIIMLVNRGSGFVSEFKGNIEPLYTSFSGSIFKISARALSRTDILNNVMLFDPAGVPTNPLSLPNNAYITIPQLLTAIYKYVDPNVTLDISNDWTFIGTAQLQAVDSFGTPTGALFVDYQNNNFQNLYINVQALFHTNLGLSSLGDVLRMLAFEFGAITGMIDNSRAFFKSIYSSSLSSKIIDNSNLLDVNKRFIDTSKTYIYLTLRPPDSGYTASAQAAAAGRPTVMQNQFITQQLYYLYERNAASGVFNGTYFFVSNSQPVNTIPSNAQYYLESLTGQYLTSLVYNDFPNFLAQYWLKYKASQQNCETHHFKFTGTDLDYLNNISYAGGIYQPIGMIKDFDLNITEIDSILLY